MYFESEEQKAEILGAEDYNEEAQNNTHQKWSINKSIFEMTIYESHIIKKFIGDDQASSLRKDLHSKSTSKAQEAEKTLHNVRGTFAGLSAFDFQAEESKEIR